MTGIYVCPVCRNAWWEDRIGCSCDSDGTAIAAHCEDNAVPKDFQARVRRTSPKLPEISHE